jgi:hypothetical protein
MTPDVIKQIKKDQVYAMKEEHLKNERMVGRLKQLGENEYEVKTMYGRTWIPRYGEMKAKILEKHTNPDILLTQAVRKCSKT